MIGPGRGRKLSLQSASLDQVNLEMIGPGRGRKLASASACESPSYSPFRNDRPR